MPRAGASRELMRAHRIRHIKSCTRGLAYVVRYKQVPTENKVIRGVKLKLKPRVTNDARIWQVYRRVPWRVASLESKPDSETNISNCAVLHPSLEPPPGGRQVTEPSGSCDMT